MPERNARDELLNRVIGNAASEKTRFFREHHAEPERYAMSTAALKAAKDYRAELPSLPRFIDPANPPVEGPLTLWGIEVIEDESLADDAVRAL